MLVVDLEPVSFQLERALLPEYAYLTRGLGGDLLSNSKLPPLIRRVMDSVEAVEVRSGALFINTVHPLTAEERRLGIPRRTEQRHELLEEERIDFTGTALTEVQIQTGAS